MNFRAKKFFEKKLEIFPIKITKSHSPHPSVWGEMGRKCDLKLIKNHFRPKKIEKIAKFSNIDGFEQANLRKFA